MASDTTGHPFRVFPPSDAASAVGPMDLVLEASAFGGGKRLGSLARPGGRLLLSGLLGGWAAELEQAYARLGCRVLARRFPGEFCTVLLARG